MKSSGNTAKNSQRIRVNLTRGTFNILCHTLEKFVTIYEQNYKDYENDFYMIMTKKLLSKIKDYSYPIKDGTINIFFFGSEAAQLIDILATYERLYEDEEKIKDVFGEIKKLRPLGARITKREIKKSGDRETEN